MTLGALARLRGLLKMHGLADAAPRIDIEDDGGPAGCRLPVEEDAAAALAAAAAAADRVWQLRGGAPQQILVSTLHAGASLASYQHLRLNGEPLDGSPADNNPLVDFYRTRDGRWFFVHGVLEHLAAGTERVLGLRERSADAVRTAVARWDAQALEDELARAGMCGAYARSADEWRAHPQGQLLACLPCVQVRRIGDAPPQPLPAAERPLAGVRVVDMTRIIAGPTASRTLAEHGADVLNISAQRLPSMRTFVIDTGHGKRSATLDVDVPADLERLLALVREGDVLVQGYRNGTLARRGLSPERLAALRPGIVYVSVNCYGHEGPWAQRPGWDQLAAVATGLAMRQGSAERPQLLPGIAALDYTTGYLAAYGAMVALARRATEGGSWEVGASLSQTAMWMLQQPDMQPRPEQPLPAALLQECDSGFGRLRFLRPVARMSLTPPAWTWPAAPLGTHAAEWLPALERGQAGAASPREDCLGAALTETSAGGMDRPFTTEIRGKDRADNDRADAHGPPPAA